MATPKKTDQGTWRVQLEINGQRDSGTFRTKREADEWNARRTIELKAEVRGGPGANKTLRDVLRRYAEEVSPEKRGGSKEIIRLAAFEKAAHAALPIKKRVQAVTSDDLGKWRDARLKLNTRGTVLRDISLLSSVLETARSEWKWIKVNPMADVRKPAEPDHRERLISGPEVRAMLRTLGYEPRPPKGLRQVVEPLCRIRSVSQAVAMAFLAALTTGMRAGELAGLRWANVRTDYVLLPMTKNGKRRDVPLSGAAQSIIRRMRGWDSELVFGVSSQSLDALFRKARTRAGLAGFTFHDSRHTAATAMALRLDVLTLCKVFGWSNPKQAMAYYNPKVSDIARRLA